MSISEEIFLFVNIGKNRFALNSDFVESIHPLESICFSDDMNRCLLKQNTDWSKSIPIFFLKDSQKDETDLTLAKHLSRVIFFENNEKMYIFAIIVDNIYKVSAFDLEIGTLKGLKEGDKVKLIKIDDGVNEITEISNVFITL